MKRLSLRMPLDLYSRVAALAKAQRRSLHNQILLLLEQALNALKGPTV